MQVARTCWTPEQRAAIVAAQASPLGLAPHLRIRTEQGGVVIPLAFNRAQTAIRAAARGHPRVLILKARRHGVTTWALAEGLWRIWRWPYVEALMVAHRDTDAEKIFEAGRTMHEHLPDYLRPDRVTENRREIRYARNASTLTIDTARGIGVRRGSTLQWVHLTEAAFYPDDSARLIAGLLEAARGGLVMAETTANGASGWFYDTWMANRGGNGDWRCIFAPWWLDDRNRVALAPEDRAVFRLADDERVWAEPNGLTPSQVEWYRRKKRLLGKSMASEYPCIAAGERVSTDVGFIPIEEVAPDSRIAARVIKGNRDVLRVETSGGYRVRCTSDHLLARADGGFVPAEGSLGARVHLDPGRFANAEAIVMWHTIPGYDCRLTVTPRWARFLGYYCGDGSFNAHTIAVMCTSRDGDVVEDVAGLMRELFGGEPNVRRVGKNGGGTEVRLSRTEFWPMLEALGIAKVLRTEIVLDRRTGTSYPRRLFRRRVRVPEAIWRGTRLCAREFLRALFEADGFASADGRSLGFTTCHEDFACEVQRLLLAFGVTCQRRRRDTKLDGRVFQGFALRFGIEETLAFSREIGFVGAWKSARLARSQEPRRASGAKRRPLCFTDRVSSIIEDGTAEVYDLTMRGEPVFDAGGIRVHNCSDLEAFIVTGRHFFDQVYAVEQARRCPPPIRMVENGTALVWEEPEPGMSYVGGGDPCDGTPNGSRAVLSIHRKDESFRQVAVLRGRWVPREFARLSARWATYYNHAFLVPERNRIEYARALVHDEGYRFVYRRRSKSGEQDREPGFVTDGQTRPYMLDVLKAALEGDGETEPWLVLVDSEFFAESMTFEDEGGGRYAAASGKRDDTIFAVALALQGRSLGSSRVVRLFRSDA